MKLSDAFGQYAFPMVIATVFLVAGLTMTVQTVWGLLTGGPRDRQKPGAPQLYDRSYYLLFAVGLIGWWIAMLSIPAQMAAGPNSKDPDLTGFLVGWAIGAIGMGALFGLRRDVMTSGARYLARHGFGPFRFFHAMQARQFDRMEGNRLLSFIPLIFGSAGIVILIFQATKVPAALAQASAGAYVVWNFISTLQFA
jgi:hypothetical protein